MSANADLDKCCSFGQNSLSNNTDKQNDKSIQIRRTSLVANRYKVSTEYELKIVETEMISEMKDFTISTITQLVQSLENIELIPENLIKKFNDLYGRNWNCFMSENFIKSSANYKTGTYIKIKINKMVLVLFQTSNQSANEVYLLEENF